MVLVLYPVGMNGNVVEFTPPLILTEEEASIGISILDRALEDVAEGRVSPDAVARFHGWQ